MLVRRFVGVVAVAAAVLLCMALSSAPAAAQTLTRPEATQHALDELANAIAQGKITRTPTPSATATPLPTATPYPTAVPPTDTPGPTATAPQPGLPVPEIGQAVSAYVQPSPGDPSGSGLELALPQGRWAILYDISLCTPPTAWTNVWLLLDEESDRPITVDRADRGAMCAVAHWSWISDVPCAADVQGSCDVELDGAYRDGIGEVEPTATETPIPLPTPVPRLTPTPGPSVAPAAPAAASAPRVEVVVQTVVVVVTAVPTATQAATRTILRTSTPDPTRTATLTPPSTMTPTLEPASTDVRSVVAEVSATPVPMLVAQSDEPSPAATSWNWMATVVVLAAVLGLVAIWLFVARSGPVMW